MIKVISLSLVYLYIATESGKPARSRVFLSVFLKKKETLFIFMHQMFYLTSIYRFKSRIEL